MATNTTNYKLVKQGENEYYDVNIDNANLDKIDTEIKKVNDKVDSKPTTALGTSFDNSTNGMTATNVQKAIEENKTSILALQNADGNLANLQTTNKANLVGAINELFQSANNGKNIIATAVGAPLTSNDTFPQMGAKIDTLEGKLRTNLNGKGVTTLPSDEMSNLIDMVKSLKVVTNNIAGDRFIAWIDENTYPTAGYNNKIVASYTNSFEYLKSFRVSYISKGYATSGLDVTIEKVRDGNIEYTKTVNIKYTSEVINNLDIEDFKIGDIVNFKINCNGTSSIIYVKKCCIMYDYEFSF